MMTYVPLPVLPAAALIRVLHSHPTGEYVWHTYYNHKCYCRGYICSNQDLIWCVKTGLYMSFYVHRGSWILTTHAPPGNSSRTDTSPTLPPDWFVFSTWVWSRLRFFFFLPFFLVVLPWRARRITQNSNWNTSTRVLFVVGFALSSCTKSCALSCSSPASRYLLVLK